MPASDSVVILSGYHDYRTKRRASIHALADAFVRAGHSTTFVSMRFSHLSRMAGDSRNFLWPRANRVETVNEVRCYLWRTTFHPFNAPGRLAKLAMQPLFDLYAATPDRQLDEILAHADYIIIESSVAAILLRRIRRLNPRCTIVYYATDRLDTVGAHPYVKFQLSTHGRLVDYCCLRSRRMIPDFEWAEDRLFLARFGVHAPDFADIGESPYAHELNAVTVGSMLFDPTFFMHAALRFPEVDFHLIGCGTTFAAPKNVRIHQEMPFKATLPFIKHATFGIAPYRWATGAEYLAESSLKIAQYEYLGIPVVCPFFAVGESIWRCGYNPGDADSIAESIAKALGQRGKAPPPQFPSWDEVAEQILHPTLYPDTRLSA